MIQPMKRKYRRGPRTCHLHRHADTAGLNVPHVSQCQCHVAHQTHLQSKVTVLHKLVIVLIVNLTQHPLLFWSCRSPQKHKTIPSFNFVHQVS